MHKITAYHCDHCRKVLVNRSGMKKHEAICPHNPVTRSCATCQHLQIKMIARFDKPMGLIQVPRCAMGALKPQYPPPVKNPHGLTSNCPHHHKRNIEEF